MNGNLCINLLAGLGQQHLFIPCFSLSSVIQNLKQEGRNIFKMFLDYKCFWATKY